MFSIVGAEEIMLRIEKNIIRIDTDKNNLFFIFILNE